MPPHRHFASERTGENESNEDIENAGDPNDYEDKEDSPRVTIKDRMSHFTWPWFAATMSTGAVAIVLSQTPNRFPGLEVIGKIFFILDIVMFVAFTVAMCLRFVIVPKKLFASLHHPGECLFFGAYWVSVALILNGIQTYGVPSSGPWLIKTLEILFWIYSTIVLLVAISMYYVLFQRERLNVSEAMPAWIFPIYPLLVIGPLAGTLIPTQPYHAAYPMWVGALMLQGLAWTVALMQYSIFTQRLMSSPLPPPSMRPGMFVSVGPAGYTSAGLMSLATQAPKVLSATTLTGDSPTHDGQIVRLFGYISGTFVLLFSFWFFCISAMGVIAGIKRMRFTLNWWAFVFPNAGLTLAVIQLGSVYKSRGVNVVASCLTVMLVALWIMTAVAHVQAVVRRKILWPGKDEDSDMNLE